MSEQIELDLENVKCGGCASTIEEGLKSLQGVENIEVKIESGHVSISGNSLSETAIREKLATLGFPAK